MNAEFLPEADAEFREAVRYYESEAPGVGLRFAAEVRKTVSFVVSNPSAAEPERAGLRKKVLNHFPYNLLYALEFDRIVIVAVAHQKRRPRYWSRRRKEHRKGKRPD